MTRGTNQGSTGDGLGTVSIMREYDVPRETIYRMFADEKKAATFWGPLGAKKLVFRFDARPGGAIAIEDQMDGGRVGRTTGTVIEVVPPELIVFRSATRLEDGTEPFEVLQTIKLDSLGPKRTRLTVSVKVLLLGGFPGEADELMAGFRGGWGETFDMLAMALR